MIVFRVTNLRKKLRKTIAHYRVLNTAMEVPLLQEPSINHLVLRMEVPVFLNPRQVHAQMVHSPGQEHLRMMRAL